MKISLLSIYAALFFLVLPVIGHTQGPADSVAPAHSHRLSAEKRLFENDKILEITLSCTVRDFLGDRSENSQYHPINLSYRNEDSTEISIPAKIKTRGHFRKQRANCYYPPLLINFQKSEALKSSIFKGEDKLKLVMPCQGDEFVVREWLVYKLYNLITPKSFRARLVRVTLQDVKTKKTASPFYGILLEEEKQMAKRNGAVLVKAQLSPTQTEPEAYLTMAVFQFLAGNTDWSVPYLHNIRLLSPDTAAVYITVPYDFDHSGLVDAPYAKPPEELNLSTVRERRYRGYCLQDLKKFDATIALFNSLKEEIYGIYKDCTLLDARYLKTTLKYLDEFYSTINNARSLKHEFGYPCDGSGTGNVIVKGLSDD